MEKILDEYGRFLLDLLAMGFLIAYLFGTVTDDAGHCGILEITGAQIAVWDTDYNAYQDYATYEAEAQKGNPVIEYIAAEPMALGENRAADYIAASAWDGVELPFLIIRVEDWRGAEMDLNGIYNEAGKLLFISMLRFSRPPTVITIASVNTPIIALVITKTIFFIPHHLLTGIRISHSVFRFPASLVTTRTL